MCPVNLDVTVPQGRDLLGKINSEGNQPRWSPPPPLATPPATRYSSCSYPQYPSSSRWVAPADFLSLWMSSYPHVQLLERNQPSHNSSSALSSLTELLVACMSARSSRNAGISTESTASLTAEVTTESKVLCCSLNASLIPLAIASSRSSLEMVESLIFFFFGDCSISPFWSPLTAEILMMGPMQSGMKFTDRII